MFIIIAIPLAGGRTARGHNPIHRQKSTWLFGKLVISGYHSNTSISIPPRTREELLSPCPFSQPPPLPSISEIFVVQLITVNVCAGFCNYFYLFHLLSHRVLLWIRVVIH